MSLVTVIGTQDNMVALWERHPDHPGGEVFITGMKAVKVALTPAVQTRLKDGRLVRAPTPKRRRSTTKKRPAQTAKK